MLKVKERPVEEVRAEYRRHDEVESNPPSRRLFESDPPDLDDAQREIVEGLGRQGFAIAPLSRLFSPELWDELAGDAAAFERQMVDLLQGGTHPVKKAKPGKKAKPAGDKPFVGRRYKKAAITLDSPWLRLAASQRMLDVVNTYLGMWSKLTYADQWYSPPRGHDASRQGSMRWHRDYNDQHLVKVFVYLCDVDEGTGPLEYVPGSARGGSYAEAWPWMPMGDAYPPPEEFDQRIPDAAVETFTGPAGSMIFCNRSGFHRGGFATDKPRSLWVFNYLSPAGLAALVERNFEIGPEAAGRLSDVERFALA